MGADTQNARLFIVKSRGHFRAGFDPIAAATHYIAAPGTLDPDFTRIAYKRVRRPIWPLDENPWE